jgi:ornithine carbamoyltransferase
MKRDFLRFSDLAVREILPILERGRELKNGAGGDALGGKSAVLLFEKPSLRTKLSFWIGVELLGGKPVYFSPEEVGLDKREPAEDVSQIVSQMADLAVLRTFAQSTLDRFAFASSVPVVNALTDAEHPCQALADLLTIHEHRGSLEGARVAYIGDGNNVAVSLAHAVVATGGRLVVASPEEYELPLETVDAVGKTASQTGGELTLVRDPGDAVAGAEFVYTDVWTSMGQEEEAIQRREAFRGYQVNPTLLDLAGPGVKFMHDMPAHPGEEISPGLLDDSRSIAYEQGGNRLWAQAALLEFLVAGTRH